MAKKTPKEGSGAAGSPNNSNPILQGLWKLGGGIWTGVFLMALLFIYCSLGSAGFIYPVGLDPFEQGDWVSILSRKSRMIELTEFEWFHWWPFDLLILLLCVNMVIATFQKVPWKRIHAGPWLIHGGIVILTLGSVYYFTTKVEGDAMVIRRRVTVFCTAHGSIVGNHF